MTLRTLVIDENIPVFRSSTGTPSSAFGIPLLSTRVYVVPLHSLMNSNFALDPLPIFKVRHVVPGALDMLFRVNVPWKCSSVHMNSKSGQQSWYTRHVESQEHAYFSPASLLSDKARPHRLLHVGQFSRLISVTGVPSIQKFVGVLDSVMFTGVEVCWLETIASWEGFMKRGFGEESVVEKSSKSFCVVGCTGVVPSDPCLWEK